MFPSKETQTKPKMNRKFEFLKQFTKQSNLAKAMALSTDNNDLVSYSKHETIESYEHSITKTKKCREQRLQVEKLISLNPNFKKYIGKSPLTNMNTEYRVRGKKKKKIDGTDVYNFRENLFDPTNQLNSRLRAIIIAMSRENIFANRFNSKVYLTEAVTPLYRFIDHYFKTNNITGSEYLSDTLEPGTVVNGIRHEDLCQLSFEQNKFDLVICLEVLEHIYDYSQAIDQLYRVTNSGGKLILSVPFTPLNKENTTRCYYNDKNELIHELKPEYHGDPVGDNKGILCYRYYGWQLIDELKQVGFKKAELISVWSGYYGIIGGPDISFVLCEK